MKNIKRLIVIFITVVIFYVGMFAPALEAYADISEFIPALVASAPVLAEDSLLVATLANPVTFVIGSSLLLCGVVYENRQAIGIEGQRFQNWLNSTGQDISDWYNQSDNSITTDSKFNDEATKFIAQEKGTSPTPSAVTLDNPSTNNWIGGSSGFAYRSYDLSSLPDGTYTIPFSYLTANHLDVRALGVGGTNGSVVSTVNWGDDFCTYVYIVLLHSALSSTGVLYYVGSSSVSPLDGSFPKDSINPTTGKDVINGLTGGESVTLANTDANVSKLPASIPVSSYPVYAPNAVVSGGVTVPTAVPVPTGTVFKPTAQGTKVGDVVGATPANISSTGVISSTPTPTPPTSGSTSDFTGIFGWLAAILSAIQLIPTVIQSLISLVTNLPSEIKGFIDNVISSIQAIPGNLQAMFNSIVDAVHGISIPNPISAIQAVPGAVSGFFDNVVSAVQSVPGSVSKFIDNVIGAIQAIPGDISGFFDTVGDDVLSVPKSIETSLTDLFIPQSLSEPFDDAISEFRDDIKTKYGPNIPNLNDAMNGQEEFSDVYIDYNIKFGSIDIETGHQVIISAKYINDNISTVRLMTSIMMSFFFVFYVYSQIYFLVRGVRPFETSSHTTVNGKEV